MKSGIYDLGIPILFVSDPDEIDIEFPEIETRKQIYVTPSCIGIPVSVPGHGDDAYVTLAHKSESLDTRGLDVLFDGKLETPTRKISVMNPSEEFAFVENVPEVLTNVVVMTNSTFEPSRVIVLYS